MDLTHKFTVPASVEETWTALNDIESVAGCFPGATVTSAEGDEFKGSCKVKLGPISLTYNGSGTFVEKDESAHRFVVEAKGKDRRGNGTATANVTATMTAASDSSTEVEVLTDLAITGRPAQFGRGVIQDVSDKLLGQFIACLEQKVGGSSTSSGAPEAAAAASDAPEGAASAEMPAPGPPLAGASTEPAATGASAATSGPAASAPEAASAPAATDAVAGGPIGDGAGPAAGAVPPPSSGTAGASAPSGAEALDLGATVLPILIQRYAKQAAGALGGLIGLLLLIRLIRRR